MSQETITILIAVVAFAVAAYAIYEARKKGADLTPAFLEGVIEEGVHVGQDFAKVAEIAVNSIEQARREGRYTDNEEAFKAAYNIARLYLPVLDEFGEEKLHAALNAAVLVASAVTAQIEHAKADMGKPTEAPVLPRMAMKPKGPQANG